MLSSFDDFPIHQTSHPVARTGSSDLNHYDRYFFSGYTRDTRLYFAAAMGLYPNRHVADASFSVVVDGGTADARQINVHASRRAPTDRRDANRVGPIEVEVIEPLTTLRIVVEAPEHGIRCDLTFTRRSPAMEEPHFFHQVGQRVVMDSTRLTQFGKWNGWIEIDGETTQLAAGDTFGCRDRSWGIRTVGERAPTGAPVADPQFFWLWAPINFEGFSTHFDVNEHFDGRRWHESGFIATAGDATSPANSNDATAPVRIAEQAPATAMRAVDYRLTWRPGTRAVETFELDMIPWDGPPSTVILEPLFDFHMMGLGYTHPEWGHGVWKGELEVAGDRWDLPVDDLTAPQHVHIQTMVKATTSGAMGVHEGLGVLEQFVIGRHDPSGLSGIFDGA
ncbi:hypothetical protein [Ilumatobacter sp.]|uniref:hypothetical protein n=1 Tax=Ilumatobacter sp. TaxID=1967498 RepID=UPI003C53C83D